MFILRTTLEISVPRCTLMCYPSSNITYCIACLLCIGVILLNIFNSIHVLPSQPGSSSRAFPIYLHFGNYSYVFCSISSFHVPESFHPSLSQSQFHLCFHQSHFSDVPVGSHPSPISPMLISVAGIQFSWVAEFYLQHTGICLYNTNVIKWTLE